MKIAIGDLFLAHKTKQSRYNLRRTANAYKVAQRMDLSNANTEGFLQFHRFHEHLNRTLKISVIGLGLAHEAIKMHRTREKIDGLLYDLGWLWGGMPDWTDPISLIDEARIDVGLSGVSRAFSAFDLFITRIEADLSSWNVRSGIPAAAEPANVQSDANETTEEADRLDRFYRKLGESRAGIDFAWPIYRYFRLARDCIVHRQALVSLALAELPDATELKAATENWPVGVKGERLSLPILALGATIQFTHKEAIIASTILRLIGKHINALALDRLGANGVVYLAARRALLDRTPSIREHNPGSALALVNWVLSDRYRVINVNPSETRRILRTLGIWEQCLQAFELLPK